MSPSGSNRFGLARDIPAAVARDVRQRCGFGCVICGCAIYQYEHLDPPFAEAKSHDADRIVLLCGGCHDQVTRGWLAKDSIRTAAETPRATQAGFSFGPFDFRSKHPEVLLGTFLAIDTKVILSVFGESVLVVDGPEEEPGPFRLSACVRDPLGVEIFRVEKNEWQVPLTNWDAEVTGCRITLRAGPGIVTLRLRADNHARLVVERLEMSYRGAKISCKEGQRFRVETPSGNILEGDDTTVSGCDVGLSVTETDIGIGL